MTPHQQCMLNLEETALAAVRQHKYAEAARLYEELLEIEPSWEHGRAEISLARCLAETGDVGRARKHFRNALEICDDESFALQQYSAFLIEHGPWTETWNVAIRLLKLLDHLNETADAEEWRRLLVRTGQATGLEKNAVESAIDSALLENTEGVD